MSDNRDYTKYSFRITFLVIAILVAMSFIPPFSIGGVHFKRVNILSDIFTFDDPASAETGELNEQDLQFLEEADRLDGANPGNEESPIAEQNWDLGSNGGDGAWSGVPETETERIDPRTVVQFIDHTPADRVSVSDFSRMMEQVSQRRIVRIAFLGDSFIEGDIITADVREQLQALYGGQGVGYVPLGNPLAISRPTIQHTFDGCTNYNIIYKKNVPEQYKEKFFVSGILSVPSNGHAWAAYKGVAFRKYLASWSRARLVFVNSGHSEIDVSVNDSIRRCFTPDPSEQVQQINLLGGGMRSVKVEVKNAEGFIGYGVVFDGTRGVSVDNYAIRSNSGLAMFGTDLQTNTRIGRMLGYDMIVLQWGLNAMDPDVTNYSNYGKQLRRVINYIKSCFPHSAIVVMGVGDKAAQKDGAFVTPPAVGAMIAEQKAAARECGVAFWDTFRAMGGANSMARFVENNWAAKDYTHLSYGGGRQIATQFVKALRYAKTGTSGSDKEFGGNAAEVGESVRIDVTAPSETGAVPPERKAAPVRSDSMRRAGGHPGPDSLERAGSHPGSDSLQKDPAPIADTTDLRDERDPVPADSTKYE